MPGMPRILRFVSRVAALVRAVSSASLPAQRGGPLTPEQAASRWALENELQSLAVVDRKVMMPMRDGVRLATDIYRPKNATGQRADRVRQDAVQLQLLGRAQRRARRHDRGAHRRQARLCLRRPERARPLLLRRPLRHPGGADDRRLRRDGVAVEAGVVERKGWRDRLLVHGGISARRARRERPSRVCRDERAGIRRRHRPRRPLLRAGQLVSRRRHADAVHHLAVRRAEPGAPDVPAQHVAGGSDQGVQALRPRRTGAAR